MAKVSNQNPDLDNLMVEPLESARIPTAVGEFRLTIYDNNRDNKEHLALVMGQVTGQSNVLVRIHSECYTGDVLGSKRCDCGEQLQQAMALIAAAGAGVIIYLRQEGRGIGLLEKLRAYNLQDIGYNTVEANLLLGHQPDGRDYNIAVRILEHLRIKSVQLMTNNPRKIDGLVELGLPVTTRIPLYGNITPENKRYIQTKIDHLDHFPYHPTNGQATQPIIMPYVQQRLNEAKMFCAQQGRPYVTLTYAQTLDGSIAIQSGQRLNISNIQSYALTHQLRANHEAILVGINTVLADDPRLTVRLVPGPPPQAIVLDSRLRFPYGAKLLQNKDRPPWIITTEVADWEQQAQLERLGAQVFRLAANSDHQVDLQTLLKLLAEMGIQKLMVEGGAQVITSFLKSELVDQLIVTIAPKVVGGLRAVDRLDAQITGRLPQLDNIHYQMLGNDYIIRGDFIWPTT